MSESLDDFFSIDVTATTDTQTRAGFGTALLAVAKVPWTSGARVRSYASLPEMVTAGFKVRDPGYQMAQAAFAQNPRPASVKVGQRTRAFTQVVRITAATPVVNNAAETYTAKVDGLTATFTTDATPTAAEAATGLAAAINALTGADVDALITAGASDSGAQELSGGDFDGVLGGEVMDPPRRLSFVWDSSTDWDPGDATVTGTDADGNTQTETFAIATSTTANGAKYFRTVTLVEIPAQTGNGGGFTLGVRASVTATVDTADVVCTAAVAGELHSYEPVTENVSLRDATTDPGIATDLSELLTADPDWYALAIDSNSQAEIVAAAAWVETRRRLFVAQTADAGCGDPAVTTDVMSAVKAASYGYTTVWFHAAIGRSDGWVAAGLLGNRLPADPGSDTWAFKTLAGVTVLGVSTTARAAILAKNGNVYERKNGVAVSFPGKVALGEWVDVVRGLDWCRARMQEDLFALQRANEKVSFTDEGARLVAAAIFGVLSEGVNNKLFTDDPKPVVTVPRARAVSSANRSARNLPSVEFTAYLAGAVHTIAVTGRAIV